MLLQEPVSTIPLSPRQCWLSWHINTAPEGKVGGGGDGKCLILTSYFFVSQEFWPGL